MFLVCLRVMVALQLYLKYYKTIGPAVLERPLSTSGPFCTISVEHLDRIFLLKRNKTADPDLRNQR